MHTSPGFQEEQTAREETLNRRQKERSAQKNLFVRNILNGFFMLVAVIAMAGLLIYRDSPSMKTWFYGVGLLAVVVKMIEVVLRMPGFHSKRP